MGKSSRLAIVLAGAHLFCLGVLALLLSLPFDSGVGAVTFAFNTDFPGFWRFNSRNSLRIKSDMTSFNFETPVACFKFNPTGFDFDSASDHPEFLHPDSVRMIDPYCEPVKDLSTLFSYQLQMLRHYGFTGPGMAFISVRSVTLLMQLITAKTSVPAENCGSLDDLCSLEWDAMIPFDDMIPHYTLASPNAMIAQHFRVDYSKADSRVDIYYGNTTQGKSVKLQVSQSGFDLSDLKENMFTGFSTSKGFESSNVPYVCAWSFNNNGNLVPLIYIAEDATPDAPPPPAPVAPPPPVPVPPPPPLNGPVSAPSLPPPVPIPKKGEKKMNLGVLVGVPVATPLFVAIVGLFIIILHCWCRFVNRPLRIFISHAGGPDGFEKNFPIFLHDRMTRYTWSISKLNVRLFFDRENIGYGEIFATKIFEELARFDVGLVVVTEAFFKGKWSMTELIAFVEAHRNDPTGRLRVLPLFYKLTPEDIKDHLREKTWELDWEEMSKGSHPLEVEKCRHAANWLRSPRGVLKRSDYDIEYIETICKCLDKILCKERSFASYIWRAKFRPFCIPSDWRPRMTRNSRE